MPCLWIVHKWTKDKFCLTACNDKMSFTSTELSLLVYNIAFHVCCTCIHFVQYQCNLSKLSILQEEILLEKRLLAIFYWYVIEITM